MFLIIVSTGITDSGCVLFGKKRLESISKGMIIRLFGYCGENAKTQWNQIFRHGKAGDSQSRFTIV